MGVFSPTLLYKKQTNEQTQKPTCVPYIVGTFLTHTVKKTLYFKKEKHKHF